MKIKLKVKMSEEAKVSKQQSGLVTDSDRVKFPTLPFDSLTDDIEISMVRKFITAERDGLLDNRGFSIE